MSDTPNYPVTRSYLPPLEEFIEKIRPIWESHWLTNQGPLHQELETALERYLGIENITLFTNGHLALDVAIKSLELSGEVITTPFTFASTTHALSMNGITPVFCDIKPGDYTIDEAQIEDLITPRTSAILGVHVYGNPCAVDHIDSLARRHGLRVLYDAAHAFGESINGTPIACFGDVSMFSFHATKVFHTIEGGALAYADSTLQRAFDLFKNFGITGPESVEAVGLNAKMNEFQAAMGLVNLGHLDEEIAKRGKVFEAYGQCLKGIPGLALPAKDTAVIYNNSYYPVVVDAEAFGMNRDQLHARLGESGIWPRKYFYPLVADFACYLEKYRDCRLPVARKVASSVLTLPMYSGLEESDCEYIAESIRKLSKGGAK